MKPSTWLFGLLMLPCALYAADFEYTFVEAGIVNTEVDVGPFNVDGDGFGVNGSFALKDNIRIIGAYSDQDYDLGINGSVLSVGAGFNTSLTESMDFVADLSYVDAEVATAFGSADENGYGIDAGVRAMAGNRIQLDAGVSYIDLDSSDTALHVGGRYYFSDSFAVGAGLVDNDDGLSWSIGVRAEFGSR